MLSCGAFLSFCYPTCTCILVGNTCVAVLYFIVIIQIYVFIINSAVPPCSGAFQMPTRPSSSAAASASAKSTLRGRLRGRGGGGKGQSQIRFSNLISILA